jgi:hypothetical protein
MQVFQPMDVGYFRLVYKEVLGGAHGAGRRW